MQGVMHGVASAVLAPPFKLLGRSHSWVEHLISQAGWNDVIVLSCLAQATAGPMLPYYGVEYRAHVVPALDIEYTHIVVRTHPANSVYPTVSAGQHVDCQYHAVVIVGGHVST